MDSIIDHYFPVLDALELELEALEDGIFAGRFTRHTSSQIYALQREMLEVKRAVAPLIDICNRLVRFDVGIIHADTRLYSRDIYDHVIRINEMIDMLRELLATALEANFALITISQNEVMEAQNEVMKRFAGWAAIIAVPTIIAGIYGMNFEYMPELQWRLAYPLVLLIALASCMLFLRF